MAVSKKTVKVKDTENLSAANIEKVISLLSAEKPITKKQACEILNISYNTSRLQTILDSHKEKQEYEKAQRAKKRYTSATEGEIQYIVESYLHGENISNIASRIYRSDSFVSNILTTYKVPRRNTSSSYFSPSLLPDECVKEEFSPGEKVYSARYESLATIRYKVPDKYNRNIYSIYLEDEKLQQFAYQPAEELGSLEHLKSLGINL